MIDIKKDNNMFYIGEKEDPKAVVTYVDDGEGSITINHTYVSVDLRGQKIGQKLIKKVVDYAREENKKIIPQCSFAEKEFNENKEYEDVLKK